MSGSRNWSAWFHDEHGEHLIRDGLPSASAAKDWARQYRRDATERNWVRQCRGDVQELPNWLRVVTFEIRHGGKPYQRSEPTIGRRMNRWVDVRKPPTPQPLPPGPLPQRITEGVQAGGSVIRERYHRWIGEQVRLANANPHLWDSRLGWLRDEICHEQWRAAADDPRKAVTDDQSMRAVKWLLLLWIIRGS